MKNASCNVLLADDHPLFRKGLKALLLNSSFDQSFNFVIHEASNGKEVIDITRKSKIDLFILDFKMPFLNGYEASEVILKDNPKAKIIVLTMYDDLPIILNLLDLGIKGFLVKNSGFDEIQLAVKKVLAGYTYCNESIEVRIRNFDERVPSIVLTSREKQLIKLLSIGLTSKQIAEQLELSLKTIETYRSRILAKVHANNTAELLNYAQKNGLL